MHGWKEQQKNLQDQKHFQVNIFKVNSLLNNKS